MAGFSFFSDLINPTSYSVPDAPQIDITGEQLDTQRGNAASFEAAKGLAGSFNDFMREQVAKSLREGVPGYADLTSTMAKNLAASMRGELPESDVAAEQRSGAAKALGLGLGGSPAGAALTVRNIGLRQYDVRRQGQADTISYLRGMAELTKAPMYNFENVFMTPQQRINASQWNKTNAWNVANLRNQMAAQPEPWMKALAGLGDSLLTVAGSSVSMGGGGMGMGGSGGGGGGGSIGSMGAQWGNPYANEFGATSRNPWGPGGWAGGY